MNVTLSPRFSDLTLDQVAEPIEFQQHSVRIFGKEVPQPRLVCWYGPSSYRYSGLTLPGVSMPPLIQKLCERASEAAGIPLNSVLCNLYRDGSDHVSWHSDDEPEFGGDPVIASLSFGATRVFSLRSITDHTNRQDYRLSDGSLLVMGTGTQPSWQHCLRKTKKQVGRRINLTFRQMLGHAEAD